MENNIIYLSRKEQKELIANNTLVIERKCVDHAPKTATIHGIGYGCLYDKIDCRWVYGNVDAYIHKMSSDKDRTNENWYSHKGYVNEYGLIDGIHRNGERGHLIFIVNNIVVSELRPENDYLSIILTITIKLIHE